MRASRWNVLGLTALAIGVAPAPAALAQPRVSPPADVARQLEELARQRVPGVPLRKSPQFDLRLLAPEKSGAPKSVDDLTFDVVRVRVTGNSVFTDQEVDAIFAGAVGSGITLEALRSRADTLQQAFRQRGYFLTRVFIPPQQVRDGIFEVQVIEGFISAVYIDGAASDDLRRRVESLTARLTTKGPVQLSSIERSLLAVNDLPGVGAVSLLRQGTERGATEIVVSLTVLPGSKSLSVNNTGSLSVGPETVALSANYNSPFGRVGALSLGASVGGDPGNVNELKGVTARYVFPLGPTGALASVGGLLFYAQPGASLRALEIGSLSGSASLRVHQPIRRSRASSVYVDLGVALNRSRTTLSGQRIGLDKSTVGEATLSWQRDGPSSASTSASLSAFRGLPGLDRSKGTDALVSTPGFNPDFLKVAVTAQRTQSLPLEGLSFLAAVQGQWSDDVLPAAEQVSFGGPGIGRGYDPGAQSGVRGIGGGLELRCDCLAGLGQAIGPAQLYAFVDGGLVWSRSGPDQPYERSSLASVGAGVRVPLLGLSFLDLQFAKALRQLDGDNQRSDPRALFSLAVSLPF